LSSFRIALAITEEERECRVARISRRVGVWVLFCLSTQYNKSNISIGGNPRNTGISCSDKGSIVQALSRTNYRLNIKVQQQTCPLFGRVLKTNTIKQKVSGWKELIT
jgi:hypothetical protein